MMPRRQDILLLCNRNTLQLLWSFASSHSTNVPLQLCNANFLYSCVELCCRLYFVVQTNQWRAACTAPKLLFDSICHHHLVSDHRIEGCAITTSPRKLLLNPLIRIFCKLHEMLLVLSGREFRVVIFVGADLLNIIVPGNKVRNCQQLAEDGMLLSRSKRSATILYCCVQTDAVPSTMFFCRLTEARKSGECAWLRPDGKTQVTVEYKNDNGAMVPQRIHTILISTQHSPDVTNDFIHKELMDKVIKPVVPSKYMDDQTIFHLNPSGRFCIGGPHGDAGLTGRKIIIDTYGGWGAHGGGAFSGKDPTKVDRSGAYITRQAAKSIVAAKLARRALVQVSYAIGVPEPLSVFVDTYGTGSIPEKDILDKLKKAFDFRPGPIGRDLDLKRARYQKSAAYGHFGRDDIDFTWETVKPL